MTRRLGGYAPMDYRNAQTKLEILIQYFNEERMNLIPFVSAPESLAVANAARTY